MLRNPFAPFIEFRAFAELYSRPDSEIFSIAQGCRRAGIQEDSFARTLRSLSAPLGGRKLLTSVDHRLVFTEEGRTLSELIGPVVDYLQGADRVDHEPLTVEADPDLALAILPRVLPGFLRSWTRTEVRVVPIQPRVRENVASAVSSFGVALDREPTGGSELRSETRFSWAFAGSGVHTPRGSNGGFDPESLSPEDLVYLPNSARQLPGTENLLFRVPASRRIEVPCERVVRDLVATGPGLGLVTDWGNADLNDSPFHTPGLLPIPSLGRRTAVFYLPKGQDSLAGPAAALFDAIRLAVTPPSPSHESPAVSHHPESE